MRTDSRLEGAFVGTEVSGDYVLERRFLVSGGLLMTPV
jgi:hypothetical protein